MDYRTPTSPNYTHDPNQNMNVALPPMAGPIELPYGIGAPSFDTTGQVAPPGMRPRLTTSVFEEEGSLCFQVDVNGICVARREGTSRTPQKTTPLTLHNNLPFSHNTNS